MQKIRDVRVCVGCLATDVRMHSIIYSGLLEPYQALSGVQLLDADMSDKLCWECAALLSKFRAFRFKCETAYRLLRDVYIHNFEVTEEKVKQTDRNLLSSSLSISETKSYSVEYRRIKESPLQLKECTQKYKESSKKNKECKAREEKKQGKVKQESEAEPQSHKLEIEMVKTEKVMIKPEPELDFEDYNTQTDFYNKEEQCEIVENVWNVKRSLAPIIEYNVTEERLSHDQAYEQYIARKSSLSYQKSNFKCSLCYQGFRDAPYYDKHMAKHSPKMGAFKCEFCKMRFRSRQIIVAHIGRKHSRKYTCNLCSNVSYSRLMVKTHFELHKKGFAVKPGSVVEMHLKESRPRAKRTAKAKDFDTIEENQTQEQMMATVAAREHTDNYIEAPFKCKFCYKGFLERKTYINHMLLHDPVSGEFECDICKLRVKTRNKLHKHISSNHLHKYTCKDCGNVCYNRATARAHYAWHNGVTYPCRICGATFRKKSSQMSHLRRHPTEHVCRICQQSFVSPMGLYCHNRKMHSVNRDEATTLLSMETCRVRCDACDIAFPTHQDFTRHVLISPNHERERASGDALGCGESPADKSKTPILKNDKRKRNITCEKCGEPQANGQAYHAHFRREHPGETRTFYPSKYKRMLVMCEQCGKVFSNKVHLKLHSYKHTGERPFKCATCGKRFTKPDALKIHIRSHTKELPYKCDICGVGFAHPSNMKRHKTTHSDATPYPCDVCGKTFKYRASVKSHVEFVHMKRPWPKRDRSKRATPRSKPSADVAPKQS